MPGASFRRVIDSVDAAITYPALVVPYSGQPKVVNLQDLNIPSDQQLPQAKFPGRLKGLSMAMVDYQGYVRRGNRFYPFVMPTQSSVCLLPLAGNDGIIGLLNRYLFWHGDIEIGYGFGMLCHDTLTATDVLTLTAVWDEVANG